MGVSGKRHAPAAFTPGKTRCRRLGGLQGRSGQVRKISPPRGFDPRSVEPVASRYTDYAIPAHSTITTTTTTLTNTKWKTNCYLKQYTYIFLCMVGFGVSVHLI